MDFRQFDNSRIFLYFLYSFSAILELCGTFATCKAFSGVSGVFRLVFGQFLAYFRELQAECLNLELEL